MTRLLLTILLLLTALQVRAAGVGGAFGEGHTQFSLVGGNAYAFDNRYFVIGGSVSHFVADGVSIGLSLENWTGNGPRITKYAPFVQYVFYQTPNVQPYIGTFYRHTAIAGLPSVKSTGVRAGVLSAAGSNAFVSVGIVHESYLNCQVSVYRVCSETHPELNLIFGF